MSMTSRSTLLALLVVVAIASIAALPLRGAAKESSKPAPPPEVNKKILAFCTDHLGQQVSDGECAMLVNEAFKESGAMRKKDIPKPAGDTLRDDDYVWGKLLGPNDEVLPGDIIQLRDVVIKTRKGNRTWTETMTHHTAVIKAVLGKNHFAVLHQNAGGVTAEKKKTVHAGEFDLNFKTQGEYWIYRPLPAEEKKK
jgi:hypothetical protein